MSTVCCQVLSDAGRRKAYDETLAKADGAASSIMAYYSVCVFCTDRSVILIRKHLKPLALGGNDTMWCLW